MDIVRQSLAIVFVFALFWTALWLCGRKDGLGCGEPIFCPNRLESRGKLVLSARHSIHLIRIGDRNLILALHPEGVTFLGDAAPRTVARGSKWPRYEAPACAIPLVRLGPADRLAAQGPGSLLGVSFEALQRIVFFERADADHRDAHTAGNIAGCDYVGNPFLRITIVLHFLRQALGTQGTPSNQVLIGLAIFPDSGDHAAGGD